MIEIDYLFNLELLKITIFCQNDGVFLSQQMQYMRCTKKENWQKGC